jgi:hypothetical protein
MSVPEDDTTDVTGAAYYDSGGEYAEMNENNSRTVNNNQPVVSAPPKAIDSSVNQSMEKRNTKPRRVTVGNKMTIAGCVTQYPKHWHTPDDPADSSKLVPHHTFLLGYFPDEMNAALSVFANGEVRCQACNVTLGAYRDTWNRHTRGSVHTKLVAQHGGTRTKSSRAAAPGGILRYTLNKSSPSLILPQAVVSKDTAATDTCHDVRQRLLHVAAAYAVSMGICPNVLQQMPKDALLAFLLCSNTVGRTVINSGESATVKMLDDEVRAVVSRTHTRYFLAIDGSSTRLANNVKVCLTTLICAEGQYLLQPQLMNKSLSAKDYATLAEQHFVHYGLDRSKIICLFTDGWVGNSKLASDLKLLQGQCQSHKFDLTAKVVHVHMNLHQVGKCMNALMNILRIRHALDSIGVPTCKLKTIEHRFHYLADMFATLFKYRVEILDVIKKNHVAPKVGQKRNQARLPVNSNKNVIANVTVPVSDPVITFDHQDALESDMEYIDYMIDFLSSNLNLCRIAAYNKLMAPLTNIIRLSESAADATPSNFSYLVDDFENKLERWHAERHDSEDLINIAMDAALPEGVGLSEKKVKIAGGKFDKKKATYDEAQLDEKQVLRNDIIRTIEHMWERLPQRGEPGEKDEMTYRLIGLRESIDPRNGCLRFDSLRAIREIGKWPRTLTEHLSNEVYSYETQYILEWRKVADNKFESVTGVSPQEWFKSLANTLPNISILCGTMIAAPMSVACVERGFSMLHHMAGDGRRRRMGAISTVNELRLRYHRSDVQRMLSRIANEARTSNSLVIDDALFMTSKLVEATGSNLRIAHKL